MNSTTSSKCAIVLFRWLIRTVATWLALAGSVYGLVNVPVNDSQSSSWQWWIVLLMPVIAVFCGWRALRTKDAPGGVARAVFWMAAIPGIALTTFLLQGQWQVVTFSYYRQLLLVATILPVLALVLAVVYEGRAGGFKDAGFRWARDIFAATVCLAVLSSATYLVWVKARVEPARLAAQQRWAAIGHPMPEFANNIQRVDANSSFHDLLGDLKPLGVVTFIKLGPGDKVSDDIDVPQEIIDWIVAATNSPGDAINGGPKTSAFLDAHKSDFDHIYQGILQREPAVWPFNPKEPGTGPCMRVPNFLSARKLSQLFYADACHRLEQHDEKGAAIALAAARRMTENLGQQPILVSNMIRSAVECLFSRVIARLPAEQDDMQRFAGEVKDSRLQFAKTAQFEAWYLMYSFGDKATGQDDPDADRWLLGIHPLPHWVGARLSPLFSRQFGTLYCSDTWLTGADVVQISERAHDLAASDLGEQEMDAACAAHPSVFNPNHSRAWLRMNLALLLREQALVLRAARAQMLAGSAGNLGDRQSVVIPGSKWEVSGAAASHTITMKLTPRPLWTTEGTVAGEDFFLLPLDGSKPWQLRAQPVTASSARF